MRKAWEVVKAALVLALLIALVLALGSLIPTPP